MSNSQEVLHATVRVPDGSMGRFYKELERLNKKCAEYNLQEIKILSEQKAAYQRVTQLVSTRSETYESTLVPVGSNADLSKPDAEYVLLNSIEIEYQNISNGPWSILGDVKLLEDGTPIGLTYRQTDEVLKYVSNLDHHKDGVQCDHCQVQRNRNQGFMVINNETGEIKTVGTTCLEEYTGISPAAALFLAKMYQRFTVTYEKDIERGAPPSDVYSVRDFLVATLIAARLYGYVSVSKANETGKQPTWQLADNLLSGAWKYGRSLFDDRYFYYQPEIEKALENIQSKEPDSPYMVNLLAISKQALVSKEATQLKILAGVVQNYLISQISKTFENSVHVGQVKDKITANLRFYSSTSFVNEYGGGHNITLIDDEGNKIRWKTASPPREFVSVEGGYHKCTFTVKSHGDYKSDLCTEVLRLKIIDTIEPPVYLDAMHFIIITTSTPSALRLEESFADRVKKVLDVDGVAILSGYLPGADCHAIERSGETASLEAFCIDEKLPENSPEFRRAAMASILWEFASNKTDDEFNTSANRHAGFIDQWLKDEGVVDQNVVPQGDLALNLLRALGRTDIAESWSLVRTSPQDAESCTMLMAGQLKSVNGVVQFKSAEEALPAPASQKVENIAAPNDLDIQFDLF